MKKALMHIGSEISNAMLTCGLTANLQGFEFMREAVMEIIKYPPLLQQLTTKLYPLIAKRHGIKTPVVERSMRHLIDVAYESQSLYGINELLSAPVFSPNEKPCNGWLIALLAEVVKRDLFHMVASTDDNDQTEHGQLAREVEEFLDTYGYRF